jgi:hypothetical protein
MNEKNNLMDVLPYLSVFILNCDHNEPTYAKKLSALQHLLTYVKKIFPVSDLKCCPTTLNKNLKKLYND